MDVLRKNKQLIIYILFLLMMFTIIAQKKNFHVDEISSYILSNNIISSSMAFEEGYTYMPAEQIYLDNMIVNDTTQKFNFSNVWKNQANDVHPPLYYLLTLCG